MPDSHVNREQDLTRFKKLGNLIVEEKPDIIISTGDFVSLDSISYWDSSKKLKLEGRRYSLDIESGNNALDLLEDPLNKLQYSQKKNKSKQYKPDKYFLKGNHELRLERYIEINPQMEGAINVEEDLRLYERGWNIIPYKHYLELNGILFTHVPVGANHTPISGKYGIHSALDLLSKSCVFGHFHRLETANKMRHGSTEIIQALTCGCFFEGTDDYAEGGCNSYWRGVILLDVFKPGRFDINTISMEKLYECY